MFTTSNPKPIISPYMYAKDYYTNKEILSLLNEENFSICGAQIQQYRKQPVVPYKLPKDNMLKPVIFQKSQVHLAPVSALSKSQSQLSQVFLTAPKPNSSAISSPDFSQSAVKQPNSAPLRRSSKSKPELKLSVSQFFIPQNEPPKNKRKEIRKQCSLKLLCPQSSFQFNDSFKGFEL
ncbi:Hypothetical_protein [Hexamita inflata]|uniref:Hypothetical_protein n=1 Tax=Hexamita inflata TaxID=28002 RepID=A0AA86RNQ8_9EUKA|nr:Hypothetical protein HINF_LOCUS57505 [Hexamita inflata]